MIYRIEFEDADDGGVGAYLPDMPGVSVVGESRAEAVSMLDRAVRWHVEALVADGTPLPEPTLEATESGQWSIVLDRTYVPNIDAALAQHFDLGYGGEAPFGDYERLKLRAVERTTILA